MSVHIRNKIKVKSTVDIPKLQIDVTALWRDSSNKTHDTVHLIPLYQRDKTRDKPKPPHRGVNKKDREMKKNKLHESFKEMFYETATTACDSSMILALEKKGTL